MNLISRLVLAPVLQREIFVKDRAIELLMQQMELQELEHTRFIRKMVEQFLIVQESGVDVRDALIAGLRDMDDEIARKSEHLL